MWVEAVDDFYDFFIFLLRALCLPVSWKCIYIVIPIRSATHMFKQTRYQRGCTLPDTFDLSLCEETVIGKSMAVHPLSFSIRSGRGAE
jgi:hypothetical protein